MRTLAVCLVAVFVLAGCAGNRWERTRAEDSLAGYRRFLKDAPRSPHADAARERIAYHELKRRPTLEGYEQFRAAHPDSPSLAELDALFEARTFESARASGSAAAYASFLEHFPNGSFAARARGNAEYLRERAFAGHPPEALAEFAERHPASDYAGEAQRTLRALDARQQARFATIGFHVELETPVADADRLVRTFRERAQQAYAAAGVRLVTGEPGARRVDGWITVRHRERAVSTEVDAGRMTGPGVLAETQVTLHRTGDDEPVWSETFTMRFADSERRSAGSVLFSARARAFWSAFFVPVATWPTQIARRPVFSLREGLAGVGGGLDRAVTVFADGSFRVVDLSDPSQPALLTDYSRPPDLSRFRGVRPAPGRVVLFGEDGIEIVSLTGARPQRQLAIDRPRAGAVADVAVVGDQLAIAGSKGLLRVSLDGSGLEAVSDRPARGLARDGNTLFVFDAAALYVVPADDLRGGQMRPVARLPRGLDPSGLRVSGGIAVVLAERALLIFDVRNPVAPRQLARLKPSEVGSVHDAAVVAGRVFLVGDRGLQVVDPARGRVVDSVDVEGRAALDVAGRHLVLIGSDRLQVVDATPWTLARRVRRTGAPASLSGR